MQGIMVKKDFPGGSDSKEPACNAGDLGLIPGSGRSPGEGNGYPLQYSCLENSMDKKSGRLSSWGHKESEMTERLTRGDKEVKHCQSSLSSCFEPKGGNKH